MNQTFFVYDVPRYSVGRYIMGRYSVGRYSFVAWPQAEQLALDVPDVTGPE